MSLITCLLVSLGWGFIAWVVMMAANDSHQRKEGAAAVPYLVGMTAFGVSIAITINLFLEEPARPPSPIAQSTSGESVTASYSATASSSYAIRWGPTADGHTWVSATEVEKRDFAKRLAAVSRHGNSANYFYDALETFYSEPEMRKQKLDLICAMAEAGSTALPASMRQY